jgi:hypothetical protein
MDTNAKQNRQRNFRIIWLGIASCWPYQKRSKLLERAVYEDYFHCLRKIVLSQNSFELNNLETSWTDLVQVVDMIKKGYLI